MKLATCAIALEFLGLVVGCTGRRDARPGEYQVSSDAAVKLERALQQDPASIPVIVRSRFNPDLLSMEQLREIFDRAQRATDGNKAIWFIELKNNKQYEDKRHWAVDVFFEPDSETARLRKGRLFSIDSSMDELREMIGCCYPDLINTSPLPMYVQVSRIDKPFAEVHEAPNGVLMPFRQPDEVNDDELIRIVDFTRALPVTSDPPDGSEVSHHFNPATPIVRIDRRDGKIDVYNGTQEGMLSGRGDMVTLECENGQYRVVGVGMWVS